MPAEAQVAPAPGWARSSTVTSCPASASRQPMASPATPAPMMTIFMTPRYSVEKAPANTYPMSGPIPDF